MGILFLERRRGFPPWIPHNLALFISVNLLWKSHSIIWRPHRSEFHCGICVRRSSARRDGLLPGTRQDFTDGHQLQAFCLSCRAPVHLSPVIDEVMVGLFPQALQLPADLPLCQQLITEDPSHTSLLLMRPFHSGKPIRPFPGPNLPREHRIFNHPLSSGVPWRSIKHCVKATCVLRNFPVGEVGQLPDVQQLSGSKEVQEGSSSLDQEDPEPPHIKEERNPSLDQEDPEPTHIKKERNPSLDHEDPEPPHIKEERNPSLDHEDPEPPHIKEEQEELWNCQEGEQLPGLEEADITKFPFTLVSVKSEEDDEEKPQSSQLHQSQTEPMEAEAEGEDCGGPEPARDSDEPDGHLQSETEDSSEPDTEDSADWDKTREPKSGVNPHKNDEVPVSRRTHITDKKWFSCSECVKRFTRKEHLQRHMRFHTGEKRHSCSLCDKRFTWFGQLKKHKCVCPQSSKLHQSQTEQMETEADGEDCGGSEPARISDLDRLLLSETEDATEDSSDIEDSDGNGEKTRELNSGLNSHYNNEKVKVCRRTHTTDKKTFSCSECGKRFRYISSLKVHMRTHTGEKPFSCRVCDRRFTWCKQLKNHKCGDESSHGNQPEENQEAEPRASSSAEQMETEADGEDCGGPEPARNSDQDKRIQTETEDKTEDSSEAEN